MASLDNVQLIVHGRNLQEENPELPVEASLENLQEAISRGNLPLFHEIMRKNPELARVKKPFGGCPTTALHLATEKGNYQMVKALVEKHPQLCMVRDKSSRTPLLVAAQMGVNKSVISELVAACPRSLQTATDGKKETVFLLALKNGKVETFQILLEEAEMLDQLHLLERKDFQGNNVLHIAASKKLSEVVQMLVYRDSISDALVRVNSLNKKGHTALDICSSQSARDRITREIEQILTNAGGRDGHSLSMRARVGSALATKNVLLVVIGIVIGASFTAVCNIPGSFLDNKSAEGKVFHARDLILCHLPPVFYLLVFNTAIFTVSMFAILVILWSLPLRPVVLFVTITIVIVYGILAVNILPKFWVKFGHGLMAVSTQLVFTLAFAIICSATVLYSIFMVLFRVSFALIRGETPR